jgi:hypothetical protein
MHVCVVAEHDGDPASMAPERARELVEAASSSTLLLAQSM